MSFLPFSVEKVSSSFWYVDDSQEKYTFSLETAPTKLQTQYSCSSTGHNLQCDSKIPPPPDYPIFFFIFSQTVTNFKSIFTHILYISMYTRLQIFIQLSPTLTKLCHIKRDYLVHIIMHKMSKTRAFRRLMASNYIINTFIMSTNMSDMTWRQQWRHLLSKQT